MAPFEGWPQERKHSRHTLVLTLGKTLKEQFNELASFGNVWWITNGRWYGHAFKCGASPFVWVA
jgi:hypothetical protein